MEDCDLIILWGSNARETHPIFFHHVLKALHKGAKLIVVDPRRTTSAQWADSWLGIDVGTDIALANAIGREIIANGWHHRDFVENATSGFEAYKAHVESYTLEYAEKTTGIPAALIAEAAEMYAKAGKAELCWTLGITEHRHGVDNVVALINLALLTGHVGRYGSGLNPLRGQNNVQGGGDMGALPDRLPGIQHVENDALRAKFEAAWGTPIPPKKGWHLSEMFEAMETGELDTLYVIGENPADSEADRHRALKLLQGLELLVVQDILFTKTAEMADVVLPAAAGWCESEGTVTSSERKVQRVRRAVAPPEGVRDDLDVMFDLARRLGHEWGEPVAEKVWDELRLLSPVHAGMTYPRLEEMGGIPWPCYDESHPGELFLHSRLWERPVLGPRAPFSCVEQIDPADPLDETYPLRLTTGRHLDSYNTGVQSGGYNYPRRRGPTIDLAPEDGERWGVSEGETVKISSRRGSVMAPVRFDLGLRPGLAFMTLHFPDQMATNDLTLDAVDPRSGTAEFKATAIRLDRVPEELHA